MVFKGRTMLETSKVSRSLDRKTLILWLEIIDVFTIVVFASLLNLLIGGIGHKLYFVYLPTLVLAITLVISKRGKPEGFLLHFLKFYSQPRHLSCFYSGPDSYPLLKASEILRKENK